MTPAEKIRGSEKLTNIFGRWPSFHDSEVISFELDRDGPGIRAKIYLFAMTRQVDAQGFYVLKNQSIATFRFGSITEFASDGFNHQNVLSELIITDISSRQMEGLNFEVTFDGIFGLEAKFQCKSIEVESVEPFEPSGSLTQSPPRATPT